MKIRSDVSLEFTLSINKHAVLNIGRKRISLPDLLRDYVGKTKDKANISQLSSMFMTMTQYLRGVSKQKEPQFVELMFIFDNYESMTLDELSKETGINRPEVVEIVKEVREYRTKYPAKIKIITKEVETIKEVEVEIVKEVLIPKEIVREKRVPFLVDNHPEIIHYISQNLKFNNSQLAKEVGVDKEIVQLIRERIRHHKSLFSVSNNIKTEVECILCELG